jgi:hypothetical protein
MKTIVLRRLIIVGTILLTACNRPISSPSATSTQPKVFEVTGNQDLRIARVSAILAKHVVVPTTILDAHFIEEQIGDGYLGPSDFRSFSAMKIAPKDVDKWSKLPKLTSIAKKPEYAQPRQARTWWISSADFDSLQFYEPRSLTGRSNGWIGIDRETGFIYIFSFTM